MSNSNTNLSYTLKYVDEEDFTEDSLEVEFSLDAVKPVTITICSNLENEKNERVLASFEMTRKNFDNIIKYYRINKDLERNDIV